jgi:hypothetical protein
MANSVTVQIFEGIASIDVAGVGHDAYMSIHTESIGYTIRWFGTFEWMGERPASFPSVPSTRIVSLSDGRQGQIRIPHGPPVGERFEFLGISTPPGFEWFPGERVGEAELESTTPSFWQQFPSRALGLSSLAVLAASFWVEGRAVELAGTTFCLMVAALALTPRPRKSLPEVPLDVPRG